MLGKRRFAGGLELVQVGAEADVPARDVRGGLLQGDGEAVEFAGKLSSQFPVIRRALPLPLRPEEQVGGGVPFAQLGDGEVGHVGGPAGAAGGDDDAPVREPREQFAHPLDGIVAVHVVEDQDPAGSARQLAQHGLDDGGLFGRAVLVEVEQVGRGEGGEVSVQHAERLRHNEKGGGAIVLLEHLPGVLDGETGLADASQAVDGLRLRDSGLSAGREALGQLPQRLAAPFEQLAEGAVGKVLYGARRPRLHWRDLVETMALDYQRRGFFGRLSGEVKTAVNGKDTRHLGVVEAHQHDGRKLPALDEVADGPPFQSAPLLLLVFGAEEYDDQFRLVVVKALQIGVQIEPGQFRLKVPVVEDALPAKVVAQAERDLLDVWPFLAGKG